MVDQGSSSALQIYRIIAYHARALVAKKVISHWHTCKYSNFVTLHLLLLLCIDYNTFLELILKSQFFAISGLNPLGALWRPQWPPLPQKRFQCITPDVPWLIPHLFQTVPPDWSHQTRLWPKKAVVDIIDSYICLIKLNIWLNNSWNWEGDIFSFILLNS